MKRTSYNTYIAGKITGLPEEQYTAKFERAEKELIELGLHPISPIKLPHQHSKSWEDYMREGIRALMLCDQVYALANWEDSNGAIIEVNLALSLGMNVIYQG